MVVALKELNIRGDFKTTVEYLIKLLETPAFEDNTITTGWLDELISKKLTAERPDPMVAVICGAVTKAHLASEECMSTYRQSLEKGQVPSKDVLKTVFPVDFIYEGMRYKFTATRSSIDSYTLFINGSKCAVGIRPLSDGGILVLLGAEFLGMVLILMMAGEMLVMAIVMVMFMMNPAGLNPMTMVHQNRTAAAAGLARPVSADTPPRAGGIAARAKAARGQAATGRLSFRITGSRGTPYEIEVVRGARGVMRLACTCPASRFRPDCKHRAALRLGDLSAVVGLTPDIERGLASLFAPRIRLERGMRARLRLRPPTRAPPLAPSLPSAASR